MTLHCRWHESLLMRVSVLASYFQQEGLWRKLWLLNNSLRISKPQKCNQSKNRMLETSGPPWIPSLWSCTFVCCNYRSFTLGGLSRRLTLADAPTFEFTKASWLCLKLEPRLKWWCPSASRAANAICRPYFQWSIVSSNSHPLVKSSRDQRMLNNCLWMDDKSNTATEEFNAPSSGHDFKTPIHICWSRYIRSRKSDQDDRLPKQPRL